MNPVKVFCIDGVVIEIDRARVTKKELQLQALIPIENQPIMAGVLSGTGVELLSPETADRAVERYGGRMVEDRNTETMADVADALHVPDIDWP